MVDPGDLLDWGAWGSWRKRLDCVSGAEHGLASGPDSGGAAEVDSADVQLCRVAVVQVEPRRLCRLPSLVM